MTQFQDFLKAAINMKQRQTQEDLAITALGSQGSSKDIQKVMRSFNRGKPEKQPTGITPEEFTKRFSGVK